MNEEQFALKLKKIEKAKDLLNDADRLMERGLNLENLKGHEVFIKDIKDARKAVVIALAILNSITNDVIHTCPNCKGRGYFNPTIGVGVEPRATKERE